MKFYIKEICSDGSAVYWLANFNGSTSNMEEAYPYDGEKAFHIIENDHSFFEGCGKPLELIPISEKDNNG